MAKLPDGWIFIPETKNRTTIEIKEKPLICCRNCEEYKEWNNDMICMRLGSYYGNMKPNDYCSKAVKKK